MCRGIARAGKGLLVGARSIHLRKQDGRVVKGVNWSLTTRPRNLAAGEYRLFARAIDDQGRFSNAATTTLYITA